MSLKTMSQQKTSDMQREEQARNNQKAYPITADLVDQLREDWPDIKVKQTTENGGAGKKRETIFLGKGVYGCNIYLER